MTNKNPNLTYLEKLNFSYQIEKLAQITNGKKVLLYGAGSFLKDIKNSYSLNKLNIIGIVDRRFIITNEEYFEGYKTYVPDNIPELAPDYIIVTTKLYVFLIEQLIHYIPFFSKTKLIPIVQKPFKLIVEELSLQNLSKTPKNILRILAYKIYETFGFSFFIRNLLFSQIISDFINLTKFKFTRPRKKSVLIIEANGCHGETIPSVHNYFSKLGYTTDILINSELQKDKPLETIKNKIQNSYIISSNKLNKCLNDKYLDRYDYIFFNSCNIYINNQAVDIFKTFKTNLSQKKFCGYVHRFETYESINKYTPFILADMKNNINAKVLNPHFFKNTKVHPKNNICKFITAGNIDKQRKNHSLLINAVEELYKQDITNFKIIIIGKGSVKDIPKHLQSFFEIKGRLTYPSMYKEIEHADFFLPLLDPNIQEHERYITTGTSGSFQLIYGFSKPCLIHEKFANIHGFNDNNSILYDSNDELMNSMKKAINLSNNDYSELQKNLKIFSNSLYEKSLNSLISYIK